MIMAAPRLACTPQGAAEGNGTPSATGIPHGVSAAGGKLGNSPSVVRADELHD